MSDPILELRGVTKRFPSGVEALAGVDLNVSRGEFLSLLGPSGCGKSTLLRVVAGLTPPSAGSCQLLLDNAPGRVGFVFQDPTLMPWGTVTANVLLPFRIAGRQQRSMPSGSPVLSTPIRASSRAGCGCACRLLAL
jgi:NitT/TauT family transport system ATP-binding protein